MARNCTGAPLPFDAVATDRSTRTPAYVAAAGAITVALTVVLARRPPSSLERAVARAIFDLPGWFTPVLELVMQVGSRPAIIVVALIALAVGRHVLPAAVVGASGVAAWYLSDVLQGIVGRERPTTASLGRTVRATVENGAFPSTHTSIAAALAAAAILNVSVPLLARIASRALLRKRLPWVLALACIAAALLTAVARVHLGVHWPLDVIGGAGLGAACAGTITAAANALGSRR